MSEQGPLAKAAATLKSELRPHQKRVLRKLERSGGVIVAHQLGGGKTLSSIAAGVEMGLPMEVIAPAPLVSNYHKEVDKHVDGPLPRRVRSYSKAVHDAKRGRSTLDTSGLLVIDEAHRLRNTGTASHKHIATPARKAKKRLLLTGTPIYNQVSDIATLANIAAGEPLLPENPTDFRRTFVKEREVRPGFLLRMAGVQPGVRRDLKNRSKLYNALAGHIDIYEGASKDFPGISSEEVNVPMSKKQRSTYNWHLGNVPWHVRLKIRAGLPPSKQEAKDLNAFMSGVRQTSLSPRPYHSKMTDKEEDAHTPKIQEAARRLIAAHKKNPRHRSVVYSNYLEAGLGPYSRRLTKAGIPHNAFTGKVSRKEKNRMIREYNDGTTPVLLVSSSGTEGLDLKGTRTVQLLEPHFNNSKLRQVIGRGRRYKSHAHLPEEERHVAVERFYSTLPKGLLTKMLRRKGPMSAEQYLKQLADNKDELTEQFRDVMRDAHKVHAKEALLDIAGHAASKAGLHRIGKSLHRAHGRIAGAIKKGLMAEVPGTAGKHIPLPSRKGGKWHMAAFDKARQAPIVNAIANNPELPLVYGAIPVPGSGVTYTAAKAGLRARMAPKVRAAAKGLVQ